MFILEAKLKIWEEVGSVLDFKKFWGQFKNFRNLLNGPLNSLHLRPPHSLSSLVSLCSLSLSLSLSLSPPSSSWVRTRFLSCYGRDFCLVMDEITKAILLEGDLKDGLYKLDLSKVSSRLNVRESYLQTPSVFMCNPSYYKSGTYRDQCYLVCS